MIDVAAYALLKRGITTAGTGTGTTITDAKIENGELILIMSDGTTVNAGKLPTGAGIDDSIVSTETTWSSEKIVEHTALNEERIAEIALDVTERALSEFVPELITGGNAANTIEFIEGGSAFYNEDDVLYGMDADEEPVGVDFKFEEE
jgi:hypothetical protein